MAWDGEGTTVPTMAVTTGEGRRDLLMPTLLQFLLLMLILVPMLTLTMVSMAMVDIVAILVMAATIVPTGEVTVTGEDKKEKPSPSLPASSLHSEHLPCTVPWYQLIH